MWLSGDKSQESKDDLMLKIFINVIFSSTDKRGTHMLIWIDIEKVFF